MIVQLTAIGFGINAFTATQDVAVDGMSIDLVPLEEEGRLNAFMSFGKTIGWAITSAVTGTMLVVFGMKATALVCALGAAAVFIYLVLVRERHGERLLELGQTYSVPLTLAVIDGQIVCIGKHRYIIPINSIVFGFYTTY